MGAGQEVEVAALVGLPDVSLEHVAPATLEPWLRRSPGGTSTLELGLVDQHVEPPVRQVELDDVAGPSSASGPPTNDSGATWRTQAP